MCLLSSSLVGIAVSTSLKWGGKNLKNWTLVLETKVQGIIKV